MAVLVNIRRGAVADRIKNPAVQGVPRPVRVRCSGSPTGSMMQEVGTVADDRHRSSRSVAVFWRRYPRHPVLLMAIAATRSSGRTRS